MNIGHFKIIESQDAYKIEGKRKVKKKWYERLTWKFWEKYKYLDNVIPMLYIMEDERIIICHPSIRKSLENEIEKDI